MRVRWFVSMGLAGGLAVVFASSGCAAVQGATSAVGETNSTVTGAADAAKQSKEIADAGKNGVKDATGKGGAKGGAGGKDADGDGTRLTAKEAKVNEAITDDVDAKTDAADWRVFDLAGKPGFLTVELHWDEASADLSVDVYNSFGENVASSPKGPGTGRKVLTQVDQPGKYYVRITANKGASVYTFMAKWAGGGGAAPSAPAPTPPPVAGGQIPNPAVPGGAPGAPGAPAAPGGAPVPAADDPMHPRAKILQSYREGSDLVLYIDKGSASNIKAGMTGIILEGADGDKPLDGGTFRITKVVDSTKSIGKATVSKIGKNTRCVINLVK